MKRKYNTGRWKVFSMEGVDSTQAWMRRKLQELPDRSAVLAASQSSGRGRRGRRWVSPSGGFYASFLLKPSPPPPTASCVSLLAAVVLVRLMGRRGIRASVKWPNDVIVGGKKIAGIVAETGTAPVSWFVLGIGVNLVEAPFIPDRVFLQAGSWGEFGIPPAAADLMEQFLGELDVLWRHRADNPLQKVSTELDDHLWGRGELVEISGGGEKRSGRIDGIAPDGSLVIQTPAGKQRLFSGEISLLIKEPEGYD